MFTTGGSAQGPDWGRLAGLFRILPTTDLLAMDRTTRHQEIRATTVADAFEQATGRPVRFHRGETLSHPDPTGRQLRALQMLLRRTILDLEAVMAH